MALILDVLFDNFVRDVAAGNAEVTARPQVPPPELLCQMRKLLHQLEGAFPFEHLDEPTDGHSRRHAHEQMHMVFRDVPFDDGDFVVAADFAQQLSHTEADLACHDWLTVLRHPHQVQMDAEDRMRAVPVLCHAANLARGGKPAKAFA